MRDPYEILGVAKTAILGAIPKQVVQVDKAKLAQLHPTIT